MPNQVFQLHPLDENFVGPKPIEVAPVEAIQALEAAGHLIIERKRNGHGGLVSATGLRKRHIELYSRGAHALTEKFPALVEELREISIPRDTLLAGEMVVTVDGGIDAPSTFGRFASAKPKRAIELQAQYASVQLALFNVIVHKGKSVIGLPYADRLDIIRELTARHRPVNVDVVAVLNKTFAQAKNFADELKWEGLVLYDKRAGSTFRLDGRSDQPPRPDGCWKWKPYLEGDFVATGWIPSTSAKFKGLVKDLLIAQHDLVTHELVSWGKVGIGLSAAERREFADDSLYPMVFEVEFERRTPKKRLISAKILRRRTDKTPGECYSPV